MFQLNTINKQKFLDSLFFLVDPKTGKTAIKNVSNNIIYWDVPAEMIAPWKITSTITKTSNYYTITFPTNEFTTNQVTAMINAELILMDDLLAQNKIELRYTLLILNPKKQPESFSIFYNIDPATYNVIPDNSAREIVRKNISQYFMKYDIDPVIITDFHMWINDLISSVFKEMKKGINPTTLKSKNPVPNLTTTKSTVSVPSSNMTGGGTKYYKLYNKYKCKYLNLVNKNKL